MSRILVVEDDPHILRVICMWLRRQGHELFEARNGAEGLELYKANRPEIVVTDVNMPVMDGLQLLQRVQNEPWQPRGVIVLTNRWDHEQIGLQLQDQGVCVVPKPFSPTRLAERIQEMAGAAGRAGAVPPLSTGPAARTE
jgi:CheY-like chemotaxis protein